MVERIPWSEACPVFRITSGEYRAEIAAYGAVLRVLRVPDRAGRPVDVCLGYDTLAEYQAQDGCLGAVVGPYANRISGARFRLHGVEYPLEANEGRNTLHSGSGGFHRALWDLSARGEDAVTCVMEAADGQDGFPGARRVEVTYTLRDGGLVIDYQARSDRDTVLNLTHHAYFNLAGQGSGRVDDHVLTVHASRYTPADAGNIPTGEVAPVVGTPLDLRAGVRLGDVGLPGGLDHNLVLDGGSPAAELYSPATGVGMVLSTDLEGLQVYTAGGLSPRRGKGGAAYGPFSGV